MTVSPLKNQISLLGHQIFKGFFLQMCPGSAWPQSEEKMCSGTSFCGVVRARFQLQRLHVTRSDVTEAPQPPAALDWRLLIHFNATRLLSADQVKSKNRSADHLKKAKRLRLSLSKAPWSPLQWTWQLQTFFSTLSRVSGRLMSKQMRTASESG